MKLKYETPSIEEVLIISSIITESPGTGLNPGDEIVGGEEVEW